MRRAHLAPVLSIGLLVFIAAWTALPSRITVAEADFPAADLSTSLLFHCLPDGTVRAELKWTSYNQGPQWLDLTLFNNDFEPGTFQGIGPFPSTQASAAWDGLTPGVWYFSRVNTLTPFGWVGSRPMAFITPPDCLSPAAAFPYYPPRPPSQCLNLPSQARPVSGCLWHGKADYEVYVIGEPVVYCYSVGGPMHVRIVATKPDGTTISVADRFDGGTGACIGPYQANVPFGLRTVTMYGPGNQVLAQTHFSVR